MELANHREGFSRSSCVHWYNSGYSCRILPCLQRYALSVAAATAAVRFVLKHKQKNAASCSRNERPVRTAPLAWSLAMSDSQRTKLIGSVLKSSALPDP